MTSSSHEPKGFQHGLINSSWVGYAASSVDGGVLAEINYLTSAKIHKFQLKLHPESGIAQTIRKLKQAYPSTKLQLKVDTEPGKAFAKATAAYLIGNLFVKAASDKHGPAGMYVRFGPAADASHEAGLITWRVSNVGANWDKRTTMSRHRFLRVLFQEDSRPGHGGGAILIGTLPYPGTQC